MKCLFHLSVVVDLGIAALFTGCASGPAFNGPRPGETWYVSTERVAVRQSADALSPAVKELAYSNAVTVVKDVRVAPAFAGDRSKFPEELIPGWVKTVDGYVPVSSLSSGWLLNHQDPNEAFSADGMLARRKFSGSETPEGGSVRGAVGSGMVAESADLEAVEQLLKNWQTVSDAAILGFLQEGQLRHAPVPPEVLDIAEKSAVGKALGAGLQGVSSGLGEISSSVAQPGDAASDLVSGVGNVFAGLIYSESGPLQEFQLGKGVSARILPNYVVTNQPNVVSYAIVPKTDPRAAYVEKVGMALALASNDPMPYQGYHFVLLESAEVNAFAVPGGFVFITTGMLDFLKDEDELAAILGHEIGHAELRHGMSAVGKEKVLKLFSVVKQLMTQPQNGQQESPLQAELRGLIDSVFQSMTQSIRDGYGCDIESQADWRSLQLSSILGYDPKALYEVLERFKSTKGTYGGAGYPAERGQDILTYRRQFGYGDAPSPGRAIRAGRYRSAMGK